MRTRESLPLYRSVPIEKLIPYANNARTHSKKQVAQIAASIKEFGFINPVIIDGENGIVAGHGRVLAAQLLERTEVPCIEVSWLTDAQRKAYILADNKLALNAGWDDDLLRIELQGLDELHFDLSLIGFSPIELADFLENSGGETDPDEVVEPPERAVSKAGDIWLLGNHRIICGDCTDPMTVERLLAGVRPHLMVTDPPYGVDYDPKWRARAGVNKNKQKMGEVLNDDRADWSPAWALFPGDVAYVWHGGLHAGTVADSLMASKFNIRSQIIWVKDRFALSRGQYHWQHEPCWYAVRGTGHWAGDRKQSTVWNITSRESEGIGHSTQKPVECMKRPILNNSSEGQAIYEPFSGSGTTIIACEITQRCCFAVEINPVYVDMAVMRWQNFTGKIATREFDGVPFNEVESDEGSEQE